MSHQAQPVRGGDVYPASAAEHEAAHERDKIIEQGREQRGDGGGGGGLQVKETDLPAGRRLITASAGGQVMAQFTVPVPDQEVAAATDAVTIGEALQAAAQTSAGDRPVGVADAAAVQAAEARATGLCGTVPGGVAAAAQQAAEANMKPPQVEGGGKARLSLRDVVGDDAAAAALPADKVATREDAEKVAAAAARNAVKGAGAAGNKGSGVVEAVAAAADMNEGRMM
ncbi:hypothetical protein U9M48_022963 [Paspalum notatum var. saurae]|uniref:SMP domain-containing protein n=1 Tax=Paspalum notatum var. saurae TaxID=547442 RepID=A0AAQ3TPA9_PASNO